MIFFSNFCGTRKFFYVKLSKLVFREQNCFHFIHPVWRFAVLFKQFSWRERSPKVIYKVYKARVKAAKAEGREALAKL